MAYFAVSGLDIMNKLDKLPHSKQDIIDWIYKHQIDENISGIVFILKLNINIKISFKIILSNRN